MKYFALIPFLFLLGCSDTDQNTRWILDQAEFALSSASSSSSSSSIFYNGSGVENSLVSLPHQWVADSPEEKVSTARYQIKLPSGIKGLDKPAVYIPRWSTNAEVLFNGHRVRFDGQVEGLSLSRYWNHPQLIALPSSLFQETDNRLEIRLYAVYAGLLSRVYIDEHDLMLAEQKRRIAWQIHLNEYLLALTLGVGIFMFFLWSLKPAEKSYLFVSLASVFWAIYLYGLIAISLPIHGRAWWWLLHTSIDGLNVSLILFGSRFRQQVSKKWESVILILFALSSVSYLLLPIPQLLATSISIHSIGIFALFYMAILHFKAGKKTQDNQQWFFAGSLCVLAVLSWHDAFLHSSMGLKFSETRYDLGSMGAPLVLIVIAWNLAVRFTDAMSKSEYLSENLQEEVISARQKLDEEFEERKRRSLEAEKISVRRGIYRYLHEEIGDKLVALLHSSANEKQEQLAQIAIRDLREAFRLSGPETSNRLDLIFDDCFSEASRRCDEFGIELEWAQEIGVKHPILNPALATSIRRVIREAMSNAFKHSDAKNMAIEIRADIRKLTIQIQDDGIGIGHQTNIPSLEARVTSVNGELTIHSSEETGTCLIACFSLEQL